jgi:hypothetical protein
VTFPVRFMAIDVVGTGTAFHGHVMDTMLDLGEPDIPVCQCLFLSDAIMIARALNIAYGYKVE